MRRGWRAAAGAAPDELHDVTMAANEAIQNAMEHAHALSRRTVDVTLDCRDGTVAVTVSDKGEWHSPRESSRGRGLPLMRALMDSVEIDPGVRGTTVTLRRALRGDQPGMTNGTKRTGSSSSRTTPDDADTRDLTSRSSPSPTTGATSRPPAAS
jgi:anti-sigma regulatory factor (Ser/Thr protein kinase)